MNCWLFQQHGHLKYVLLSRRNQYQKVAYCISFIWHYGKDKTIGIESNSCQGKNWLTLSRWVSVRRGYMKKVLETMELLMYLYWWWVHKFIHVLKFSVLYTPPKWSFIVHKLLFKWKTLMHNTGCLGLVNWDDPEGWYGEGGGRRVQDGEHMYT